MKENKIRSASLISDYVESFLNSCREIDLSDKETIDEFSFLISNQFKINTQIEKLREKLTDKFIDEELTKLAEELPLIEFRYQKDFDHEGCLEHMVYVSSEWDYEDNLEFFKRQEDIEDRLRYSNYLTGSAFFSCNESFFDIEKYKIYKSK